MTLHRFKTTTLILGYTFIVFAVSGIIVQRLMLLSFKQFLDAQTPTYLTSNTIQDLYIRLKSEGYTFIRPCDYHESMNQTVILAHDIDFRSEGVTTIANIERSLGLRSCFYPRPDAEWYTQNIQLFQSLESEGWEIGFQYDCLSRANNDSTFTQNLFDSQIKYMRTFFDVRTINDHGDSYNLNIANSNLATPELLRKYNVAQLTQIPFDTYIRDTNCKLVEPAHGNIILVQLHADWYK